MSRISPVTGHLFVVSLVLASLAGPAVAQRGGGKIPAVGSMLPSITAFDEQGEKFSISSLKGSYTVLVFGCLT